MPTSSEWNNARVNGVGTAVLLSDAGFTLSEGVWRHAKGHVLTLGETLGEVTIVHRGGLQRGIDALRTADALGGAHEIDVGNRTVKARHWLHPFDPGLAPHAERTREGIAISAAAFKAYSHRRYLSQLSHQIERALLFERGGKWHLKGSLLTGIVSAMQGYHYSQEFELVHDGARWTGVNAPEGAVVIANRRLRVRPADVVVATAAKRAGGSAALESKKNRPRKPF